MEMKLHYSGSPLDRATDKRRDESWIADKLHDRATRIVPVWRNRNLVSSGDQPHPITLTGAHARGVLQISGEVVFLGLQGDAALFAADVSSLELPELASISGRADFYDLRDVGPLLDRADGALLAYARGITHWHARHRFCGDCGAPTQPHEGGHARDCTDRSCGAKHFPRTDPAVIMLVSRPGPEGGACLLARQAPWPKGVYSTLAGYVEPGESLEEAVVREVMEETGIKAGNVRYVSSQPWPFPASLMLGFQARAENVRIDLHDGELEDARWFTKTQLKNPKGSDYSLPRPDTIARALIEDWLEENG